MSCESRVRRILAEIAPGIDLLAPGGLVSDGRIDSFDVVLITGELEKEFDIAIDVEQIVPENYDSIERLVLLVQSSGGRENAS